MYFCPPNLKMKTSIFNIFSRSWELMMTTAPAWEKIQNDNVKENSLYKGFVLPWTLLCSATVLIFEIVYATDKIYEAGFIKAFICFLSMTGSFYFTRMIALSFFKKNFPDNFSKINIEKITAYSFSVIYVTKIITTILPSLFFLQILNIYTVYIVWEGCRLLFNINEDERGKAMLLISLCIIFMPSLINRIILFMLPSF